MSPRDAHPTTSASLKLLARLGPTPHNPTPAQPGWAGPGAAHRSALAQLKHQQIGHAVGGKGTTYNMSAFILRCQRRSKVLTSARGGSCPSWCGEQKSEEGDPRDPNPRRQNNQPSNYTAGQTLTSKIKTKHEYLRRKLTHIAYQ